jgi:hypothetical protein
LVGGGGKGWNRTCAKKPQQLKCKTTIEAIVQEAIAVVAKAFGARALTLSRANAQQLFGPV